MSSFHAFSRRAFRATPSSRRFFCSSSSAEPDIVFAAAGLMSDYEDTRMINSDAPLRCQAASFIRRLSVSRFLSGAARHYRHAAQLDFAAHAMPR